MKKNVLLIAIFIFTVFGFQSCLNDNDTDKLSKTARIQLKLVDSPGDYLEVNVEIIDIQYNISENKDGWISLPPPEGGYPINVDLTKLIAGNDLLLTDEIIPAGMLKQVRLILSDNNNVVIEGQQEGETIIKHLDTPSAQQSGLKLKLDTELEPGFSYTFILDWDVQRSIVKAGNSGKYILKPVIKVITEVNSGSISGKVVGAAMEGDNPNGLLPLKNAKVSVYNKNDDYITGTITNENGDFIVRGLEPGDYILKIEHNNYINYMSEDTLKVTVGSVLNIGIIELKVPVS